MLALIKINRFVAIALGLVVANLALSGQSKVILANANKMPLPTSGLIVVQDAILVGYSAATKSLVFETHHVSEGRGGYSDNFLFRIDAGTGKELERVQTSFDSYENLDADEPREKAMAQKGLAAIKRWGVAEISEDAISKSGIGGFVARFPDTGKIVEGGPVPVRFYIKDSNDTWFKPLLDNEFSHLSDDNPSSVQFKETLELPGYPGLLVRFYRSPIMEYDSGTEIYLCLAPQLYAQFLNEVGYAFYGKKNWNEALAWFSRARQADPTHVTALYNGACTSALLKIVPTAIKNLETLKAIGSPAAFSYLKKVANDSDFDSIRNDPAFTAAMTRLLAGIK